MLTTWDTHYLLLPYLIYVTWSCLWGDMIWFTGPLTSRWPWVPQHISDKYLVMPLPPSLPWRSGRHYRIPRATRAHWPQIHVLDEFASDYRFVLIELATVDLGCCWGVNGTKGLVVQHNRRPASRHTVRVYMKGCHNQWHMAELKLR